MASSFAFVSAVLLVYCIAISASHGTADHETDIVVVTTSQLREEIKSQLDESLTEILPELPICASQSYYNGTSVTHSDIIDTIGEMNKRVPDIDTIKEVVEETVRYVLRSELSHLITPGFTPTLPSSSCMEIHQLVPDSPSGHYWIRGTDNGPKHMYCDMERSCKGVGGGWMRVASIDMTDCCISCPPGLNTIVEGSHRLCGMNINGAGCSSTVFPVEGVQYSRVCGKIIGYQQKTPDGFKPYIINGQTTIDSYYVDGISLTHGKCPRKHVWTFVAALHEYNSARDNVCPCTNTHNNPPPAVPSFVGQCYFCDTGSENHYQYIFYANDPLWDGAGCGQFSTCCTFNSPPWFLKEISPPTNDDIEMRLCSDENRSNEDITVEILELYVQ